MNMKKRRRRRTVTGYGGAWMLGGYRDRDNDGRDDLTMTSNLGSQFDGYGDGGDGGGDGGGE